MISEPTEHPSSPDICWRCWAWGGEWICVFESDDGQKDWDEVPCLGCGGTGLERDRQERERRKQRTSAFGTMGGSKREVAR